MAAEGRETRRAPASPKDTRQCPLERRERDERDKLLQQTADGIPKPRFEQEDCGANEPEGVGRPGQRKFCCVWLIFSASRSESWPARAMARAHRPVNYDAVCASAAISFSLRFGRRAMILRQHGVDRRQDEEPEQRADRHAGNDNDTDREAARRARAGGSDKRNQTRHHRRRRHQDRAQTDARGLLDRRDTIQFLVKICNSRANSTIRMPCLLISPIKVTRPTCV